MKQLYPEIIEKNAPPKNLYYKDIYLFEAYFNLKSAPTTLEVKKNIDILNDALFDLEIFKFYDKYTNLTKPSIKQRIKRLLLYLSNSNRIDKGIWIIDEWSSGYFHWFCDALTRLIATDEIINDHYVLLPDYYKNFKYIEQSLDVLKYKVLFYQRHRRLHVNELLLPSHNSLPGNFNHIILNKLKDKFRPEYSIKPTKKIYISREKAMKRRVLNEVDILPILKNYGYEIHYFEDYNFNKQLRLMQEATHLIGLHGAGLTNMLFMPTNGKILELRMKESSGGYNCFYRLASILSHEYYYLINEADRKEIHTANVIIDPSKLKYIIEQMG